MKNVKFLFVALLLAVGVASCEKDPSVEPVKPTIEFEATEVGIDAYADKAKDLFRELMVQASYECGFEAEDIPLMIEAIPVSGDCLVLVVTKVEDPDELDTRFSNFSIPKDITEEEEKLPAGDSLANEILECFGQLGSLLGKDLPAKNQFDE